MPTFQGLLKENEIHGLVEFIKSLARTNRGPSAQTACAQFTAFRRSRGDSAIMQCNR